MTREETARTVKVLMSALRMSRPVVDDEALLSAWHFALHDLDYGAVQAATAIVLREETYFPEPSKIRTLVIQATLGLPDADQAWRIIQDRLRNEWDSYFGLPRVAQEAIVEAVKALGGTYTLRNSERPERDRDTFYTLWPDIRTRYLRHGLELPARAIDAFPPEVHQVESLPPGILAIRSGDQVRYVKLSDLDTGYRYVSDDAPLTSVPKAILQAPPSKAEQEGSSS